MIKTLALSFADAAEPLIFHVRSELTDGRQWRHVPGQLCAFCPEQPISVSQWVLSTCAWWLPWLGWVTAPVCEGT